MHPEPKEELECRKVSDALEVEQLDINLFRSFPRHFWVPAQGRGVFGGQVISQALVSATHTVDPAFAVHVSTMPCTPRMLFR